MAAASLTSLAPADALTAVRGGPTVWDVDDAANAATDDGSVLTGTGEYPYNGAYLASPFDGYGSLRAAVTGGRRPAGGGHILRGFGLRFDGIDGWGTTAPVSVGGVSVSRQLKVDESAGWLRYVDSFTNTADEERTVRVSFGGSLGYSGPGLQDVLYPAAPAASQRFVAATSSGDTDLTPTDTWVTLADSATGSPDGAAVRAPAGVLFGGAARAASGRPTGFGDYEHADTVFTKAYGSKGTSPDFLGVDYLLHVPAGATVSLAHFLTAGAPDGTGTATARAAAVSATLRKLAAAPALADLPLATLCGVRNFDVASMGIAGYSASACAQQTRLGAAPQPHVVPPTTRSTYPVAEKTIRQMEADMASGRTTSVAITRAYLDRIRAFDTGQAGLHSYLYVDEARAIAQARAADRKRKRGGRGALLGIPVGLKDLYSTKDMPTTAGSLALLGSQPTQDATSVARLRKAGAVIIGKLNLSEFAYSGYYSESGVGGTTYNPYDPDRSPAGSSGGSGASTSANLNSFSMGTDTCGSLQGVAGVNGLATIRATRGLTSTAGVFPLEELQDSAGPLTRTVPDLARVLGVLAGTDPADPTTKAADAHTPAKGYGQYLQAGSLQGKRLGYLDLPAAYETSSAASTKVAGAVAQLHEIGATVIDTTAGFRAAVGRLTEEYHDSGAEGVQYYQYYVDQFLKTHQGWTRTSLADIAASGRAIPWAQSWLDSAVAATAPTQAQLAKTARLKRQLKAAITAYMDAHHLDALVYTPVSDTIPLADSARGFDQTCDISAYSGLPGVTVAAGLDADHLPVGLEFLGRDWSDGALLGYAYAFEQRASRAYQRKAPRGFGNLRYQQ